MSATVTVTVTDTNKVTITQPEQQQQTEPINNNPTSTNDAPSITEHHITTQPILKLTRLNNEHIQIEYITPTSTTTNNNVYEHNWTHTFPNNAFLSDIISHFNTTSLTPTPFPNHIKLNNHLLPLTTSITTLFPLNTNSLTLTFSYLPELADSYHSTITSSLQHISQLLTYNNVLLLFTFHRKTRTFTSKHLPSSSLQQTHLHLYSPSSSALCNAPNALYISGGDSSLTHFWKINLTTCATTSHSDGLPVGKTSHSMIYIPHKYVFIIGGSNDNNVYYYNEDTTLFEQWAALNSAHAEPACALVNDALLYVFSNDSRSHTLVCERTNLRTQPYWEKVVPKVENKVQQRLFGCCWDGKDEKVLLFGGSECTTECTKGVIAYDWKGNMFVETKVKFMECDLKEKTFLPFNDKYSYVLPKIKGKNVKLVCYNNIAKEFKEIAFIEDEDIKAQQQRKTKLTLTTLTKTMKHHTNNIKSNINYKKYNFDMPMLNNKFLNTCSGYQKPKVNKTYTNTPFGNSATGDDNANANTNTNNIFDQLKE